MKKIFAVAVILLIISVSIIPSTGTTVEKSTILSFGGKTLYVGGSGEGNYTRIQDAIDNASDGDTVFVYNEASPYWESVFVNKSISLVGENGGTPDIYGDPAITLNTDGAIIHGFGISSYLYQVSMVLTRSEGNEIYSNIILDGFYLDYSHNNKIHNNTLLWGKTGIHLQKSNKNNICDNEILEHRDQHYPYGWGIIIEESNFTNIKHNNFHDNDGGILCIDSNGNNILQNIFSNDSGIYLENSDKNKIIQNIFSNGSSMILDASYLNAINYNNLDMDTFISFDYSFSKIIFPNNWNRNYWGKPRILPKPIFGTIGIIGLIPWVNFDWHPAKEPYDIGV